ncbi:putative transmembrane protein [Rosellinia necatrix]|uniref:Putative transmembrane protein n=1 Tax=Rosellinia necatrix TaxID=77044 RepID=A0A1W2TXI2_ROSNE|nr:putative transmembrane protein [Rosellinia necatrix]
MAEPTKLKLDKDKVKEAFDLSSFDLNAVLRGAQLTLVGEGALTGLCKIPPSSPTPITNRPPSLSAPASPSASPLLSRCVVSVFISISYLTASFAVVQITGVKVFIGILSYLFNLDQASWDDTLVNGLDLIANHVLQIPLFLMTLMRYMTPTLDDMFMDSLHWVDITYVSKHKHENPDDLRDMYYPNLRQYKQRDGSTHSKSSAEAITMFIWRFVRKASISLAVFALSYTPYIGKLVLPAASFYTFNKAVGLGPAAVIFGTGIFLPKRYLVIFLQMYFASRSLMRELLEPYFARIYMSKEQKRNWFRSREGLLFGFGIGFYILLRVPLLGVLIYGIAEASTAYLITKITDPPPPPSAPVQLQEKFLKDQQLWKNKHEFLDLSLANLDATLGEHPKDENRRKER